MSKITQEHIDAVDELFSYSPPSYMKLVDTKLIRIRIEGHWHSVTPDDVKEYIDCPQGMSGMRYLGNIEGDWRQMDSLAEICESVFNVLCPEETIS